MSNSSKTSTLSDKTFLVVGDVMLDEYLYGETKKVSPEAPVPVVNLSSTEYRLGGAANVAINLANLGMRVFLVGILGTDEGAGRIKQLLANKKVKGYFVENSAESTIKKTRIISKGQQMLRLDEERHFSKASSDNVMKLVEDLISSTDVVVLSDYAKGTLAKSQEIINCGKRQGKMVAVDPKSNDFSNYCGADLITPNLKEFIDAGGKISNEQNILSTSRALLTKHDIGAMLLTRGSEGMTCISDLLYQHIKADKSQVIDVTGAGDTVIAVLVAMLSIGFEFKQAAEFSSIAAAKVIKVVGTSTIPLEELYTNDTKTTILSQIQRAKVNGEILVFTNGCFDILHAGHVKYLESAKKLGQKLVIGINSDDSVMRLKGSKRPINSLSDRVAVLNSLSCVDWVIPFGSEPAEQDTPKQLIDEIEPDIIVKGGDYSADQVVGAESVLSRGGRVETTEYYKGLSTSALVKKIKEH